MSESEGLVGPAASRDDATWDESGDVSEVEAFGADDTAAHQALRPPHTAIAALDSALEAVAQVARRPSGEHLAVFEAAHDQLRVALEPASADRPG